MYGKEKMKNEKSKVEHSIDLKLHTIRNNYNEIVYTIRKVIGEYHRFINEPTKRVIKVKLRYSDLTLNSSKECMDVVISSKTHAGNEVIGRSYEFNVSVAHSFRPTEKKPTWYPVLDLSKVEYLYEYKIETTNAPTEQEFEELPSKITCDIINRATHKYKEVLLSYGIFIE